MAKGNNSMPSSPNPGNAVAVLFAGGRSSRMMRDKSLLPFGGYGTMGEYQYRRLKKYFAEVYISCKEDKFNFEAPLILDRYPQSSPLVGILSVFETIEDREFFVLSVDAPFVDRNIITTLYDSDPQAHCSAVTAESPQGIQPLCGIYRRSIIPNAKAFLARGDHRLTALLKASGSCSVRFEEESLFANLNYPEEYDKAVQRLRLADSDE